jgi:hypothetical protein
MTPAQNHRTERGDRRVYGPDTLKIMTVAFDRACGFLPGTFPDNVRVRRRLALHIIRLVDGGELDPTRLATAATRSIRNNWVVAIH